MDGLDGQGGDALAADAGAPQLLGGGRGSAAAARQGRPVVAGSQLMKRRDKTVRCADNDLNELSSQTTRRTTSR